MVAQSLEDSPNKKKHINKSSLTVLTMMEIIKVSSRGQIVIPERVRKHLGIKEGTTLILMEKGNSLVLETETDFEQKLALVQFDKEKAGWLHLAEKRLSQLWDNDEDEATWSKYL